MTLILQNLPGSFNQMSVPKRKKVLTQYAGQTIGSYNTFDSNIEESLDTGGALAYREGWINEKLNVGANLEFEAFANESTSGYITNEGRAVAVDKKGFYREFIIRVVKDTSDEFLFKRVEAEGSEYELIDEWLPKYEQVSTNLKTALGAILAPTRFEVGQIDDPYSVKPVKLKHMSVRQAVNELIKQFGGEVRYRVLM